jgi:hypothetical protein
MNSITRFTYEEWAGARCMYWEKQIKKAIRAGNCPIDFEYIVKLVIDKKVLLFDNVESFAIVEVNSYDGKYPFVNIFIAGGNFDKLHELERDQVVPFAKKIGANKLTMIARQGFKERLPSYGWKQPMIYFEKGIV